MDFSNSGAIERVGSAFRAHVQWRDNGQLRHAPGPRRTDRQAAQNDLESMRSAASGKSREEGFAAVEAEAKRLREGKEPTRGGAIQEVDGKYRAHFFFRAPDS